MGKDSKIEWTDHTFNPWTGCTKVSEGCAHCYAESLNKKFNGGRNWGVGAPRAVSSDAYWRQPFKWDVEAQRDGVRRRVFCASMADVFDPEAPADVRKRLWNLIAATPFLDWLLLTKRPERVREFLPDPWGPNGWPNVWLGTSVENQRRADERVPRLLNIPARVRFLSCEPLLGPVSLLRQDWLSGLHWVITGGESGRGARPVDPEWFRMLKADCEFGGVAFFMKQMGTVFARSVGADAYSKGGEIHVIPADLHVRDFPKGSYAGVGIRTPEVPTTRS